MRVIDSIIGGRYHVISRLAAGGMATVFEAEHTGTGRRVALKVVHQIMLQSADSQTWLKRFMREARVAGGIDDPHIAQVFDVGVDEKLEVPYIAMELLSGRDLRQLLKVTPVLPPQTALRIAAQACLGLERAHAQAIVHRDIKPANMFLAKGGADTVIVKLLDFGIAKVVSDEELTQQGATMGTISYMAPEQIKGTKNVDQRADLWALGVVLYRAMSGRLPFLASEAGPALVYQISILDPPPLQQLAPWVPERVANLVHRVLERDPDQRVQSATELLSAIRELVPGGVLTLTSVDLTEAAAEFQERVAAGESSPSPEVEANARDRSADATGVASVASVKDGTRTSVRKPLIGRSWGARFVVVLALGGVLAMVLRWRLAPERRVANASAPASASASASVVLDVSVRPRVSAHFDIAGKQAHGDQVSIALPAGTAPVLLRVEAEGFEPTTLEVVPDRSRAVLVQLDETLSVSALPSENPIPRTSPAPGPPRRGTLPPRADDKPKIVETNPF